MQSMTGYGRATASNQQYNITIEIKVVNGKSLEIFIKQPNVYNEKEIWLRTYIKEVLERGTVQIYINRKDNVDTPYSINEPLIKNYYNQIKKVAEELNTDTSGILAQLITLPETLQNKLETITESEFELYNTAVVEACKQINIFRKNEGDKLKNEFVTYTKNIQNYLAEIVVLAPERLEKVKNNLLLKIQNTIPNNLVDSNRLEQELIFYVDKMDIAEEVIRLQTHCNYFLDFINSNENGIGKKMNFILQEFGREINTIGSKANDVGIQQLVVKMKEDLEKMKEQSFNIL